MKMKLATFVAIVPFLVLLLALDSDPEPQAKIAIGAGALNTQGSTVTRPPGIPSVPSPFGVLTCVSSDCSPVQSETEADPDMEKLHPQVVISTFLDKIGKGDSAALTDASEVLRGCFLNHRNRLMARSALGVAQTPEINECESSQLKDLVLTTDFAVGQGFGNATLQDSNKAAARLRWLATRALLEDEVLQLAALPKIIPNSEGEVDFSSLPVPQRRSTTWMRVASFVNEHSLVDPEVQNLAKSLIEISEEPVEILATAQ